MLKRSFAILVTVIILAVYTLPYFVARGVATGVTIVALVFLMVYRRWMLEGLKLDPNGYLGNFIYLLIWFSVALWIFAGDESEAGFPFYWIFIGVLVFSGLYSMRFSKFKRGG